MAKKTKHPSSESKASRSSKEERLFQNIYKITQQFMQGKGYNALSEADLLKRLGFPPQHATILHDVLKMFVEQGFAELTRGQYRWKKELVDVVTGVLRVHPRGFGFLQADEPKQFAEDIFIPKHLTQNAVDGDRVEVQVNLEVISDKGPEGKVITILSRGKTHVVGIIHEVELDGDILAYVPMLGTEQRVIVQPNSKHELQIGDRIAMEVVEWGSKKTETICRMSRYLGHISDPSSDVKVAIEEYELQANFPSQVIKEAGAFGTKVLQSEIKKREDLRELETFTIDPDTAKDFDDALSVTKDERGCYQLGVHIADVSHYVRPGSALDQEARQRCNSTYFPGYCLPMLPSELSENLCSLKSDVNRLTVSVIVQFDPEGNMIDYRIVRSVIKSAMRFTYREAKAVLDGKKRSRHKPTLQLMVELCGLLKRKRYERGSIEFSLPDLAVIVDKEGVPQKIDYVEYDITHQLVEEFMLKANELVAWHLTQQGKNLTFRVHDEPAEENMRDFSILAGAFGFHLSQKPTQGELQKLFDEALKTSYGPYLATSYIRRMRLALYSPENIGHYGLGLTHYCHFTSPIRRYVDLIAHRILFGESDDLKELENISSQASQQERLSAKAENSVITLKKLRLINSAYAIEPQRQYEAVITRIKNFGIFFEVLDFMLEGFLHVSELANDYYVFDEANIRLKGTRHGGGYSSGDRITVMLKRVDLIFLESQWSFISESTNKNNKQKQFQKKRTGQKNYDRRPLPPIREKLIPGKKKASKGLDKKPKGKTDKKSSKKPKK